MGLFTAILVINIISNGNEWITIFSGIGLIYQIVERIYEYRQKY